MISNDGGRPSPGDIYAFKQFKDAYAIDPPSLLFVFNKIDPDWGTTEQAEFREVVFENFPEDCQGVHSFFFPWVDVKKESLSSPKVQEARSLFLGYIVLCNPRHHTQVQELSLEYEKVAEYSQMIEDLKARMKADQENFERRIAKAEADLKDQKDKAKTSAPSKKGGCVSMNTSVRIKRNLNSEKIDIVSISQLRPGQFVEVAPNVFEEMLEFYHYDQSLWFEFYRIQLVTCFTLELSDSHWIRTKQEEDEMDQMKWGCHLKVGDKLYVRKDSSFELQEIENIEVVKRKGVFAPNTWKGVFLTAEGIEVSCYSDLNNYVIVSSFMRKRNMVLFYCLIDVEDFISSKEEGQQELTSESEVDDLIWQNKIIDLEETAWLKAIRWSLSGLFK